MASQLHNIPQASSDCTDPAGRGRDEGAAARMAAAPGETKPLKEIVEPPDHRS
jgi:hypothetical protein